MLEMNNEIMILFKINIFSGMGYSLIAPLLPLLGIKKGINEELLGLMISFFSLSDFLTTPFIPKLVQTYGKLNLLIFSTCFEASCIFLYGILYYINSYYFLIIFIFILRAIHGACSSIIGVLIYSLANSICEKSYIQTSLGYIEIAWAIGMVIGPILVSVLYCIGGYSFAFIYIGLIHYYSMYLSKELKKKFGISIDNNEIIQSGKDKDEVNEDGYNLYFFSLFNLETYLIIGIIVLCILLNTFYYPSLTNYLMNNYHLYFSVISLFFLFRIIFYFFYLQKLDSLANRIGKYKTIILSLLLSGLGFLVIYSNKIIISIIFGLALTGCTLGQIGGLTLIVLNKIIREKNPNIDEFSANDISSSIYNFFFIIGEIFGPVLGGLISSYFGFKYSCLLFFCITCFAIIIFYVYFLKEIKIKENEENKFLFEEGEDIKGIFLNNKSDNKKNVSKSINTSLVNKTFFQIKNKYSFRFDFIGRKKYTFNLSIYNKISRDSKLNSFTQTGNN